MPNRPISQVIQEQDKGFVVVPVGTSVRNVAWLMKEKHATAVLVVRDDHLAGICSERDIVLGVVAEDQNPDQIAVDEIMTSRPTTILAHKPFGHALHLMYEGGFHHLPVVNDEGVPVGLLCTRDALSIDAVRFSEELVRREEIAIIL